VQWIDLRAIDLSSCNRCILLQSIYSRSIDLSTCNRLVDDRIIRYLKDPHPAYHVYPSGTDLGFWQVLLSGPPGDYYSGGTWLLWIRFPASFPEAPPVIRFQTPILHCNINSTGRVCHSVLDRNW
jgi:ubiquitin-protein ligase